MIVGFQDESIFFEILPNFSRYPNLEGVVGLAYLAFLGMATNPVAFNLVCVGIVVEDLGKFHGFVLKKKCKGETSFIYMFILDPEGVRRQVSEMQI